MPQKIIAILRNILLVFLPFRTYDLLIAVPRHTTYENPKCPSRWKGSGCYDIDLYGWRYIHLKVHARTEREALNAFESHRKSLYKETFDATLEQLKDRKYAESSARERAEDASYADCEILTVIPCKDTDGLKPHQVEECEDCCTDWSKEEEECLLEDALQCFGLTLA